MRWQINRESLSGFPRSLFTLFYTRSKEDDSMDLLVVGGGGREHAIIKKLKENPVVETIYALPGNGGIAADAGALSMGNTSSHKPCAPGAFSF